MAVAGHPVQPASQEVSHVDHVYVLARPCPDACVDACVYSKFEYVRPAFDLCQYLLLATR
jgi:hypothetical protein